MRHAAEYLRKLALEVLGQAETDHATKEYVLAAMGYAANALEALPVKAYWFPIDGDLRGYTGAIVMRTLSASYRASHTNNIEGCQLARHNRDAGYTEWIPLE